MNDLRIPGDTSGAMGLTRRLYENRIARFVAVGGSCGVIQLSILHGLVAGAGMGARLANLIAFLISMELNFVLNQFFTWRDRWSSTIHPLKLLARMAMFNVSAASTSGVLNQGVSNILMIFIWYLPAAALGICAAASVNFLLNDRLVFRLWSRGGASATIPEPQGSANIADGGSES
jgi:putative flippase GtrA